MNREGQGLGWRDLEYRERWSLVVSTIQAFATLGAFMVALIGIWRVAPIITYQVEKQRAEALPVAMGETSGSEIATRFTTEAIAWWTPRVRDYARIIELIRTREDAGLEVSFELIEAPEDAGSGTWKADVLVVAAKHPREEDEVIRVEVNDRAMTLAHFLIRRPASGSKPLSRTTRDYTSCPRSRRCTCVPTCPWTRSPTKSAITRTTGSARPDRSPPWWKSSKTPPEAAQHHRRSPPHHRYFWSASS
jgi:hypothetical protein